MLVVERRLPAGRGREQPQASAAVVAGVPQPPAAARETRTDSGSDGVVLQERDSPGERVLRPGPGAG